MIDLTFVLDFIGFTALFLTHEVHASAFLIPLVFLVIRTLTRWRLSDGFLISVFSVYTLLCLSAWLIFRVHPVLVVAYAAPVFQATLWLMEDAILSRDWRIVFGFFQLVIASALSIDFYLSILLFIYFTLSAVQLSHNFIGKELRTKAPDLKNPEQLPHFTKNILAIAGITILLSAVIFPILPRTNSGPGVFSSQSQVGYTEQITLSSGKSLSESNSSSPVLRIYPEKNEDLLTEIYLGLLRTKTLSQFDGTKWAPNDHPKFSYRKAQLAPDTLLNATLIRESLDTDALPVPYGTSRVLTEGFDTYLPSSQLTTAEWVEFQGQEQRIRYRVQFASAVYGNRKADRVDPPTAETLFVPDLYRKDWFKKLSERIFKLNPTDIEKMRAVGQFFAEEGFSASLGTPNDTHGLNNLQLNPIERFLLIDKSGHCELFSTAAALLLRSVNIPTRLVAGFRISSNPIGNVIIVRSHDAHAWVEAWSKERGWTPLDFTPRSIRPHGFTDYFTLSYDWASLYWAKYVLSFSTPKVFNFALSKDTLRKTGRAFTAQITQLKRPLFLAMAAAGGISMLGLLFLWVWFPQIFSIRWRVREATHALKFERRRLERLLKTDDLEGLVSSSHHRELQAWTELYQKMRFSFDARNYHAWPKRPGSHKINSPELKVLRELFKKIAREPDG